MTISRRRFLQLSAAAGGALALGDLADQVFEFTRWTRSAYAAEPIKVGIIDPLSSPYKTSSIHDVHGATVAMEMYNKRGGVLGRQVAIIEADDASNVQTGIKAATKLLKEDRVDFLMGTFNGDVALAVADVAKQENKLFMATCPHIMDLTGSRCDSHTFVFMANARMMAQAVAPHIVKVHGNRCFMVTADTVDGKSALQAMTEALKANGGEVVGTGTTPFGTTDFTAALTEAKAAKPSVVILNLYGWDLVNALKAYVKLELAKEKIGVGGMIGGEQIGRPLGYANNAGVWGLVWDPKINTESSKRFVQGVIDKYNHTPTSRCYLGYAAMTQIIEAVRRAGTTDTAAVIKALEGHEFDGCKEGRSYFRAWDHQHVQDVLVGQAYGKELGLGHYQILATVRGDTVAGTREQSACRL
jgi:branched-chain amino acid transport system substrate-binding protein